MSNNHPFVGPQSVAYTILPNGFIVSTVKLYSEPHNPRFETCVFADDGNGHITAWDDLDATQVSTREQALLTHYATLLKWSAR